MLVDYTGKIYILFKLIQSYTKLYNSDTDTTTFKIILIIYRRVALKIMVI